MGSIDRSINSSLYKKGLSCPAGARGGAVFLFFLFALLPLFAQNEAAKSAPVSLASELARLEKLGAAGQSPRERYDAFMSLARLYQLSGNSEAALKACDGALAASPGDGQALLVQTRLLLSLGEYEKAGTALNALIGKDQEKGLLQQGWYLGAQLEAFNSGNTMPLAVLADDPDFAVYRAGIYYTLWKLTGLSSWQTRLIAEFPQSPEAKIAGGGMDSAVTPLWLLYPGRDSIGPAAQTPAPATSSPVSIPAASIIPSIPAAPPQADGPAAAVSSALLQTGLFGQEQNAKNMADNLKKAGFEPQIIKRQVSGGDRWAVCVPSGENENATIKKLKDAGFESFPLK